MTNNYIVTSKGFLKGWDKNEKNERIILYTDLIREALSFKTKTAKEVIETNNLEAFIWNPFKEEPITNKWQVVQRQSYEDFLNEETHKVLEWRVIKVRMENKTDAKFLNNRNPSDEYHSYEEAVEICNIKNLEMLKELEIKIKETNE